MKKTLFSLILVALTAMSMAQTATNFTVNDCSGASHDLFTELNAGKVIVICWVMPCGACTGPALTSYNVVQSYQSSNPNTVYLYLVDDYANTTCTSLNSWAASNGIAQSSSSLRFSNAAINMLDYGSTGMPKTIVLGGANHTVFYNVNNTINSAALQNAINSALATTGINEQNSTVSSLNVAPNPAGNSAEIKFILAKSTDVKLELFNLEGQMVQNIFSGKLNTGENKIVLNLADYASGMYLIKLTDADQTRFMNVVVSH